MTSVREYLADGVSLNAVPRRPQPGKKNAKGNYIAFALVPKNTLPDFGTSYTIGSGSAAPLTGATVAAAIKALCIAGTGAYFFGNGTVNGKKGKPKEWVESMVFGTRTKARPTGEVDDAVTFDLKYFYQNVEFFNKLRFQQEFDIYMFTDRTVEVVRYDWNEPVFDGIGHEKAGDVTKDIVGSLAVSWTNDFGELVPEPGVTDSMLIDSDVKLTFGTSTVTGLTAVAGVANAYALAATTAGSLTPSLNETGVNGLKYSIFKNTSEAIPTGEPVTINTISGAVAIGTSMTAGIYKYTIVAENATGVFGTLLITINHA